MKRKVDSSREDTQHKKTEECSRYRNWFFEVNRHGYFVCHLDRYVSEW